MIHSHITNSRLPQYLTNRHHLNVDGIINSLIESRNIFSVQTVSYDILSVYSTDLDSAGNFLLVGLSNGAVDLQGVQDSNFGTLDQITRINLSPFNSNRVQWNPGEEQFFSVLDNHSLFLIDPVELRAIDRFCFNIKTIWSEWNPNDEKLIAVCGTESQTRLVDLRSGSSIETIILGARSGLASHRANRCLWSKQDRNCLIVGDNEGYLHVYDTRHSTRPHLISGSECGQISGMSFTSDNNSLITSQGTENRLVQWSYDRCSLKPDMNKFKKKLKEEVTVPGEVEAYQNLKKSDKGKTELSATTKPGSSKNKAPLNGIVKKDSKKVSQRKSSKRVIPLPVDAYIRCQFYVTNRHIYCPVPARTKKSKEIYIYDLYSGYRIKTLKSDDILSQGIHSVTGLLPDSLVLYVGGRGRIRVWTLDEDHQKKMEEKIRRFHRDVWDSDEEL